MPRRCRQCKQYSIPGDVPVSQFWCGDQCKVLLFKRPVSSTKNLTKVKAKPVKKKLKSIARSTEDCAETLQRLVRVKAAVAANANGFIRCFTCSKAFHWKEMQGGHFIERRKLSTKLLEENVHCQCDGCNGFAMKSASGVLAYRAAMVDTYGEQFVQDLIAQSKQVKKYTRSEVEQIHADFKQRLAELEAEL